MKRPKLFFSSVLVSLLGVGVFSGISLTKEASVEKAEAAGETYYVRGGMNGWNAQAAYSMVEGNAYRVLDISGSYEFKIADDSWNKQISNASGSAINNGVTWNGSNNSNITKGKYAFKVSSGDYAVIEKISSKYFNSGETIYLRLNSSFKASSATCYINVLNTDNTTTYSNITSSTITTKGDESLVKYTFSKDAYFFEINRKDSTGSNNWGWSSTRVTSHSHNLFEVSHHTDWGWDKQVEIAEQSASIVNVSLTQPAAGGTIAVKNANGDQSGAGYYYSDWSLQFTASPAVNYYFKNWTDASGNDWQGSDKYDNPVTLTGLSGEFGVSCKFALYSEKAFKVLGSTTGTWTSGSQDIEIPLSYQSGTSSSDDGATYYSTSVSLTKGSVFKPVNVSDSVYYDYDSLEEGENSVKGTYIVSDGTANNNMKVVTTAVYEIYVKTKTGKVWMQLSSASEAEQYALTFLDTITCNESGPTFALNKWNKVGSETTSMEYKYEHLTQGARDLLKNAQADKDSDSAVERCAARYDRILSKYGYGTASGQRHDFMTRNPSVMAGRSLIALTTIKESGSTVVAIAIIVGASAAAVGGYFLLRKKKED